MANIADAVTCVRIALSPFLLLVDPHSLWFLILSLMCGLTDILDGWIARKFDMETEFGAKLDSFADLLMFGSLIFVVVANVEIPVAVWIIIISILAVKTVSFAIGKKHGFFGFRHTRANRITGVLVFFSVPLFLYFNPLVIGIALGAFALFAALNEMNFNIRDMKRATEE